MSKEGQVSKFLGRFNNSHEEQKKNHRWGYQLSPVAIYVRKFAFPLDNISHSKTEKKSLKMNLIRVTSCSDECKGVLHSVLLRNVCTAQTDESEFCSILFFKGGTNWTWAIMFLNIFLVLVMFQLFVSLCAYFYQSDSLDSLFRPTNCDGEN